MRSIMFVLLLLLLPACSSSPEYSQVELAAIETREFQSGMGATFDAATDALPDAGYTILMSDRAAGLLTGSKGRDPERHWLLTFYAYASRSSASMTGRPISSNLASVRIKTASNNEQTVDRDAADEIWRLMGRQVMLKAPWAVAPGAASLKLGGDTHAFHHVGLDAGAVRVFVGAGVLAGGDRGDRDA